MDLKDRLKKATKSMLMRASNLHYSRAPVSCSRVLTYHSVGHRDHAMNVLPQAFTQQMQWLAGHHRVISPTAAAKGENGVAITFDDGYRDNLTNAAPVLSRLEIPATVFIVTGKLGAMLDHDSDFDSSVLMTWDEVSEIESCGFEIGAHTVSHARLSTLQPEEQHFEILGSAEAITGHLGHNPDAFAYPYGSRLDFSATSKTLVRESGFEFAFSNQYGVNGPDADTWALRRIWIDRTDSLEMFQAKVEGRLDLLSLLDSAVGIRARKTLNSLVGG